MPGGQWKEDRPSSPCPPAAGASSKPAHRLLPHLLRHRLLFPAPWGLRVWGEGSCLETVLVLGPHPEVPAPPAPDPPPPHRTEDTPAGPPRLKLYKVVSVSPPPSAPMSLLIFFSPFLPSSPHSSLGSAQVKWFPSLPAFMDHQLTSCCLLFSLCVCLSYFSSSSPFSFWPSLPPSSAM